MGRNVGKRACWAGENRHVYSKYYAVHKKERDGQAWLEEKKKRRGVSNCHGIALRRRRPTQSSAGNKQLGWISQPKKKRKENPCSQRAARSALINNPPTDQQCVRPTHVLISVSGGKTKLKNKNNFCPVIHAENVGHTRLPQLTVLIREKRRATGNSRRFHFVRVLCSCRGNKKIIISPGSFVSIRPAENLKEMLFSSWLRPESTINHIVPCCLSHPIS